VSTIHSGGKVANKVHSGGCYHCHYFINISTWCTYLGISNSKKLYPICTLRYMQDIFVPKIWVGRLWNLYIYIYIYEKSNQIVNVFQFLQCANVFNYANLFEHFQVNKPLNTMINPKDKVDIHKSFTNFLSCSILPCVCMFRIGW
jgi:hypothetical protein